MVYEIAQKEDETIRFIRKVYTLHHKGYTLTAGKGLFLSRG